MAQALPFTLPVQTWSFSTELKTAQCCRKPLHINRSWNTEGVKQRVQSFASRPMKPFSDTKSKEAEFQGKLAMWASWISKEENSSPFWIIGCLLRDISFQMEILIFLKILCQKCVHSTYIVSLLCARCGVRFVWSSEVWHTILALGKLTRKLGKQYLHKQKSENNPK